MIKTKYLKEDHRRWVDSGTLSPELDGYIRQQLFKRIAGELPYTVSRGIVNVDDLMNKQVMEFIPAKNGFIVVWKEDCTYIDKGDKPQPEDSVKVGNQLYSVYEKCPNCIRAYHKYPKAMRTFQLTGTFKDNDRLPVIGQQVWINPAVNGTVMRICSGVPELLSYVDVKVGTGIMTLQPTELFDHKPEVVTYTFNGDTFSVWE